MARLTNTYRQYKADTRLFASWLATTARANGWSEDFIPVTSPSAASAPPSTSAIPGGTGNKKKKKNQKGKPVREEVPASAAPVNTVYAIAIRDFLPMAELLAKRRSHAVVMPASISAVLERVIRLREAFAQLLHQQGFVNTEQTEAKNHSYFVDILKQVRDILTNRTDAKIAPENDSPSISRASLSTAFAALHVYEPSQAFLDAPSAAVPTGTTQQYEIAEDEASLKEDAQVAFAAMLQDVLLLREEVHQLWTERYSRRTFHLAAVAIATNTAIDLARKMEEEAAVLDRFGGAAKFLIDHYHAAATVEGLNPRLGESDVDGNPNAEAYNIANKTMYEAYIVLDRFREACAETRHSTMPRLYDGQPHGWYNPDTKYRSTREKYDRDCAALLEVLSEIAILDRKLKWGEVQDELTRGVRLILADPSQPVRFWTIFAAQLFIDNLEKFDDHDFQRVDADLKNIGRWIAKRAEVTLSDIAGKPRPSGWPAKKDSTLRRLLQDSQFFETEVISKWKRRILPNIDRPKSILVQHNAVLAGVWAHHLLTLYHTTSIAYVNAWGAVFAMNQLWEAVWRLTWIESHELPKPLWTDMLVMDHMQDRHRFWVGSPPLDLKDFWKQWCLCQGVSLANFIASKGALPVAGPSNATRRGLTQLAPVNLLFRGRLGSDEAGHARINMTLEEVQNIVGEGEWIIDHSSENVFEMVHEYERASNRPFRETDAGRRHRPSPGRQDHLALSPAALIKNLAATLHAEMAELHYDYLFLHQKCWLMLTNFKKILFDRLMKASNGSPDFLDSEAHLPQVVGIIFRAAAGMAPGLSTKAERLKLLISAREGFRHLLSLGMNQLVVNELRKLGIDIDFEIQD